MGLIRDGDRPTRAGAAARPSDDQGWAGLADLALAIAREIQFRGYIDERAVRPPQSEGMVMSADVCSRPLV
ncbi:hypothetical protein [Pseudofrankia sp. BMG5.37]|uniref:hypothetical protein n=1 Tax=Pseudofrankia sp. BMG5.37 TaxID=3050035 RepID=UPI0028961F08|nr:hypothetical protein [Pseudofrankia sp. BMG5.37]MDT3442608.1 hypothetical protein [Pseudofrankia sp. BMG5.37]